jgi:hypothetical protein
MGLTVEAAKQALKTTLEASDDLTDVTVAIGLPMDENALAGVATEAVFLLDFRDFRRTAIGQAMREEAYSLPLRVRVFKPGQERPESRFSAIADAIDAAIIGDYELGGAVKTAELTASPGPVTGTNEAGTGLLCIGDFTVSVTAGPVLVR